MGKRVFISDIHMGDNRGLAENESAGVHRYCWFYNGLQAVNVTENRPEMLATFLEQYCLNDHAVEEVIVLGDLFDQWICPVDLAPPDFAAIDVASQNKPSMDVLRELSKDGRLWYLPGNHDMLADEESMKKIFGDSLNYIEPFNGEKGHNVYLKDGIWAEHGHWYGLFNAPAKPGPVFSKSILPIGYFVSRLVAEWALNTGERISPLQILREHVKKHHKQPAQNVDDLLVQALAGFVEDHGGGHTDVVCNGATGFPAKVSWTDVGKNYPHIFSGWSGNVDVLDAARCDAIDLFVPACKMALDHEEAKIVIFGHTHEQVLWPMNELGTSVGASAHHVYANAGGWAYDAKPCTFIETELKGKTQYVRRKEWFLNETTGHYEAAPWGRYSEDCVDL
ncbi:MAG: metallophosphoesterase [Syntrophales bacterium LBB04]|nr:metallophosphoesterase [Syntrophales bacterium LBB04]